MTIVSFSIPTTARGLDWAALVRAAWELPPQPPRRELHGTLPEGVESAQFHVKVKRAAARAGGAVGVRIRGREWWVWPVRCGSRMPGMPTLWREEAYAEANRRWQKVGLWDALRKAQGRSVRIGGELTKAEAVAVAQAASRHQGMRVRVTVEGGRTMVQERWRQ